jgi:DUF971 family protein
MSRQFSPQPTALTLHQQSRVLEIGFSDGAVFRLPYELLRVYSPSAEVRGHGPGQEVLQTGKRLVEITDIEPVGTTPSSRRSTMATTRGCTPGKCSTTWG